MGHRKASWACVHTEADLLGIPAARTLIRNALWAIGDRQKAIGYRITPIKDEPGRVKVFAIFRWTESSRAINSIFR